MGVQKLHPVVDSCNHYPCAAAVIIPQEAENLLKPTPSLCSDCPNISTKRHQASGSGTWCGELLKQVEADKGGRPSKTPDAADIGFSRSSVAKDAGLSERQKVTALRWFQI